MSADLIAFLRARLDDKERRARDGYYSDTHWERFTTQAHLWAWRAWRQRFPRERWSVDDNDAIAEAARDGIRERVTAHEANRTAMALAEVKAARLLIRTIFVYEETRDGEWGCGHDAGAIEAGLCPETSPDGIEALRLLALPYDDHPDYREEWRP